jgi:hypothetical protein
MGNNYKLAMWYKDKPLTVEMYKKINDSINSPCRHYILGHACIAEGKRRTESGESLDTLGRDFGYSKSSAEKFMSYARAIDYFQTIVPGLVAKIFDGGSRLAMDNTLRLANKEKSEILRIAELLSNPQIMVSDLFPKKKYKTKKTSAPTAPLVKKKPVSIKDTPAYDPDAPVSSLSYTIPSWVSAIEKVFMSVDINTISVKARYRLRKELVVLADTAGVMLDILREEK